MKFNKFDIGGEIISILTKGMYPDPKDAIREYIQNSIDAKSKSVEVKVRQSSIIIEDDGVGMDYETIRKSIRLGISDKNPKKDVGFFGIGIYSSFHLCDILTIYTRKKDNLPLCVSMNFKSMREILSEQKELRIKNEISSDKLIDLQTLLENHISLTDEHEMVFDDFPVKQGTRVELVGLDPILDEEISDFDKLSDYLQKVIPLHFDKKNFKWGGQIENKINQICKEHNAIFELINLKLQVNSRAEFLYRPYFNSSFSNQEAQEPLYREIKKDRTFIGVVWGCLNSTRDKIADKELRGFIIKKQGFSIGNRENLRKSFGASTTHFDRYIGEVILVNTDILPNAARSDFEYSNLRTMFYDSLKNIGSYYNTYSNKFQEENIAEVQLKENLNEFKQILNDFNPNDDNPENLISLIIRLRYINNFILKKYKKINVEKQADANLLKIQVKELEKTIQSKINVLSETKRNRISHSKLKNDIVSNLNDFKIRDHVIKKYENLIKLFEDIDIHLDDKMKKVFSIIDENFIKRIEKRNIKPRD